MIEYERFKEIWLPVVGADPFRTLEADTYAVDQIAGALWQLHAAGAPYIHLEDVASRLWSSQVQRAWRIFRARRSKERYDHARERR